MNQTKHTSQNTKKIGIICYVFNTFQFKKNLSKFKKVTLLFQQSCNILDEFSKKDKINPTV